ncbi:MAG: ABC transporter substrate-binding protein [Clostridiales bacterium]|jgi:putative ABC transport system substrate-binding protein|nr:ABC transporter substrate-binding protein [Clostridiales bacterium]
MGKLKKYVAKLPAILLASAFALAGCSSGGKSKDVFTVGISQFVTVTPLDLARQGFEDKLNELAAAGGKSIEFDVKNANADVAQAQTIATTFVSKSIDLILAIATPSATTAKSAADGEIPVVFSCITDPADPETGLVESYEKTGGNITGASDRNPIKEQVDLFQELYGDVPVKKIAIIHSAEPNAISQYNWLKEECDSRGIELVNKVIASTSELQAVFSAIAADKEIQGIYLGADNMIGDGKAQIKTLNQDITRLPMVVNDGGLMTDTGAIAAFGFAYYDMGVVTAEIAWDILTGAKKAEDIPVYFQGADKLRLSLDEEAAAAIDFEIPQALKDRFSSQAAENTGSAE